MLSSVTTKYSAKQRRFPFALSYIQRYGSVLGLGLGLSVTLKTGAEVGLTNAMLDLSFSNPK